MIPRLRQGRGRDWTPLLDSTPSLRRMRVLVDYDVLDLDAVSDGQSHAGLLAGLLKHESIGAWTHADGGPPPHVTVEESPYGGGIGVPVGWITVLPVRDEARSVEEQSGISHLLYWREGESWRMSTVYQGELDRVALSARLANAGLLPDAAMREDQRRDAVAAFCAQGIEADLCITKRPLLLNLNQTVTDAVNFATPEQALPLVSLYLRSQGVFLVTKAPNQRISFESSVNRGLFYLVGAIELLPEASRWSGAWGKHDHSTEEELIYLRSSVLRRVARILQYRDDLFRTLNKPVNNDHADDIVATLESCLLLLMGAVDATARVTHRVLGIKGHLSSAGWQKPNWVDLVSKEGSGLASVVAPGTPGSDALTILSLLRNTIHSSSLPAMHSTQATRSAVTRDETLVRTPRESRGRLQAAIDRLGGSTFWGLTQVAPNDVHAEPGILLERLLPAILRLLNDLMAATPVESRLGFTHVVNRADEQEPFDQWTRQSVRWQLGISDWA